MENMKEKVGYAYISLKEYKDLVCGINEFENRWMNELRSKQDLRVQYDNIDKTIRDRIYKSCSWELKNYKNNEDYYKRTLQKEFFGYGYTDISLINVFIEILVDRYERENVENNENNVENNENNVENHEEELTL